MNNLVQESRTLMSILSVYCCGAWDQPYLMLAPTITTLPLFYPYSFPHTKQRSIR
nr:MAG TPA: hypothetical protein [Caudoviricetes sp.]